MSGEFGQYNSGYFHTQMGYAAEDLASGSDALSREWAVFFKEFVPIAHAISWSEACDSSPAYPITETINRIGRLQEILGQIEKHVRLYKRVADDAVQEALKAQ